MKKIKLLAVAVCVSVSLNVGAQSQNTLTLNQCHEIALELSPLQKQKLYLESISELNSKNYQSINYPRLMLNAQASYQSDVFSLPFTVPGIDSPIIPQDQYKVAVDFYQNIFNGGLSKSAMEIEESKIKVEEQAIEVTLHQTREVINSLFFGILKAQEQINLVENVQRDLNNQKDILEASVKEGASLPYMVKVLEKEMVTLEQQLIEIESTRSILLEMLGKWMERSLDEDLIFEIPETDISEESLSITRPESQYFGLQIDFLESQKAQLTASRIPDIGLFGTAGFGYPNAFNPFDVEFTSYWLVGLKLSWHIFDYGNSSRDKEVIGLRQQNVLAAKQNFERTLEINSTKQSREIRKYEKLIEKDQQIVSLQNEIISVSSSQLQNGIITSNDYVLEVNKGLNADISLKMHEIDLAKTKIELLTLTGNTEEI
jgi:outer membrane protein TolC